MESEEFKKEINNVINKYREGKKNYDADFLLSEYLRGCLDIWIKQRRLLEDYYNNETFDL